MNFYSVTLSGAAGITFTTAEGGDFSMNNFSENDFKPGGMFGILTRERNAFLASSLIRYCTFK